jgi:hypothetical protein
MMIIERLIIEARLNFDKMIRKYNLKNQKLEL